MNNEDRNHLVLKYIKGETTLKEEQHLYEDEESIDPSLDAWFSFVKKNKTKAPEDFNDRLWKSFPARKETKTKQIRWTGGIAIAASVVLLLAISTFFPKQETLNYAQKEALLNEALAMFPEEETEVIEQTIIYENDMFILYTSTE